MRRFLTFTLLLLTALKGFAVSAYSNGYSNAVSGAAYNLASYRVDSLKTLLGASLTNKDTPIDTLTINRINKLSAEFIDINPDSALYYGKMAIDRSIVIKYNKGIADGMLQEGKVYTLKSDYEKAQKNLYGAKLLYVKRKSVV